MSEAASCTKTGELGALLRREGLYSSHLSKWREQVGQGEVNRRVKEDSFGLGPALRRKEFKENRRHFHAAPPSGYNHRGGLVAP